MDHWTFQYLIVYMDAGKYNFNYLQVVGRSKNTIITKYIFIIIYKAMLLLSVHPNCVRKQLKPFEFRIQNFLKGGIRICMRTT